MCVCVAYGSGRRCKQVAKYNIEGEAEQEEDVCFLLVVLLIIKSVHKKEEKQAILDSKRPCPSGPLAIYRFDGQHQTDQAQIYHFGMVQFTCVFMCVPKHKQQH